MQLRGDLRPEALRILNGAAIQCLVLLKALHVRLRGKFGWRGKDSALAQDRIQIGLMRSGAGFHGLFLSPCAVRVYDGYKMGQPEMVSKIAAMVTT